MKSFEKNFLSIILTALTMLTAACMENPEIGIPDRMMRLSSFTVYAADDSVISIHRYIYDNGQNFITGEIYSTPLISLFYTFSYDGAGMLTGASAADRNGNPVPDRVRALQYSPEGLISSITVGTGNYAVEYSPEGQIKSIGGASYRFDAEANVNGMTFADSRTWTFENDYYGLRKKATLTDAQSAILYYVLYENEYGAVSGFSAEYRYDELFILPGM
jgi:hypothetical protein